jgi:hypothetical protein
VRIIRIAVPLSMRTTVTIEDDLAGLLRRNSNGTSGIASSPSAVASGRLRVERPGEMAGIALRALLGVTRPAAEGPLDSPRARALPAERERILVKLFSPSDALIEFVVRRRLGLRVAIGRRGIGHLPQRRATGRCDASARWR